MTRRPGLARSKPTSGQRGSGCSRPPTPSAPSQRSPPRRPRPTQARAARRADANRVLKLMRSPRDRVPAVSSGPTALLSTARPSPAHVLRGRHTPKMPGGRSNPPEGSEEVKGPFSPPRSLERLAPLELCAHRQIPPSPDLNASACQASERRRDARLAAPALSLSPASGTHGRGARYRICLDAIARETGRGPPRRAAPFRPLRQRRDDTAGAPLGHPSARQSRRRGPAGRDGREHQDDLSTVFNDDSRGMIDLSAIDIRINPRCHGPWDAHRCHG